MKKGLRIAIIILFLVLIILIVSKYLIALHIQKTAKEVVQESIDTTSSAEIDAFNQNFESYKGKQSGSSVKVFIGIIKDNARTYSKDEEKIPSVYYDKADKTIEYNSDYQLYSEALREVKNDISSSDYYKIEMKYNESGLIETIRIISGEVGTSSILDEYDKASNDSENKISQEDIYKQNSIFESYKGKISGNNLSTLITRLISNYENYKDSNVRMIPEVYVDENEEVISVDTKGSTYVNSLTKIKNSLDKKHMYYVDLSEDEDGLINRILIFYEYEGDSSNY
jgi:hypothetical protein